MKIKMLLVLYLVLFPAILHAEEPAVVQEKAVAVESGSSEQGKIAILPFRTPSDRYHFVDGYRSFVDISQHFLRTSLTAVAHTRQFAVIGGDDLQSLLDGKSQRLSADMPTATQVEIGNVLGLDYILTGTILKAHEEYTPYFIHVSGERGERYSGVFGVDYHLVVMETGEVKWSDSVEIILDDAAMETMNPPLQPEQFQQFLFSKAADVMVQNLMADLYPILVARVQENGDVIVNHGAGLVFPGDWFDVFSQGEPLFDPHTGQALGVAEEWRATLEIHRVAENLSYATVIDGALLPAHTGSVCRLKQQNVRRRGTPGRVSDVQPTYDGGIVLPFD